METVTMCIVTTQYLYGQERMSHQRRFGGSCAPGMGYVGVRSELYRALGLVYTCIGSMIYSL